VDKVWDNSLSTLVTSNPQAFLDLVFPGTKFVRHHRNKLKGTQRQPDVVMEVKRNGRRFIINIEFQTYKDAKMAERLLLYHVLLWWHHKGLLPVKSYVIYLLANDTIAQPPLSWTAPGEDNEEDEEVCFRYKNIGMWKVHTEDLLQLGHVELFPFLPLTQEGARREIVEQVFDLLAGEQHHEIALIGFLFAALIFHRLKRDDDQQWLERRFRHMHDILRESPVYEWILAEGREEGEMKGEAKGIVKGIAQGVAQMRQAVVEVVQERFASLTDLAAELVATINDLDQLRRLVVKISTARGTEQARQTLLNARPQ